jgi:hypothetical protein
MLKLLLILLLVWSQGVLAHPRGTYSHQRHLSLSTQFRYVRPPVIQVDGEISYTVGNGRQKVHVFRYERMGGADYLPPHPVISEDEDGRVYELRYRYYSNCGCYQLTWVYLFR